MGKDKQQKDKIKRIWVKWAMKKRGIKGKDIAARLNITWGAVSKGLATSPRIVAALIEAGVPARLFKMGQKDTG